MENSLLPGGRFRSHKGFKRTSSKNNIRSNKYEKNDPSHELRNYSPAKTEIIEDIHEAENFVESCDGESKESSRSSSHKTEYSDSELDECQNEENEKSSNDIESDTENVEEKEKKVNSIRRSLSCDSEISVNSSSVKSSVYTENGSSIRSESRSSTIPGTLDIDFQENIEDSSSPLLKRKKRNRDMFKDTDSEKELQLEGTSNKHQTYISEGEEEDGAQHSTSSSRKQSTLSDFELMMQRKRAEKRKKFKSGTDSITQNDELIVQLIDRMEHAAYEDRKLNKCGLPATKKISMLKYVVSQLRKKDLQTIFLEHNILSTLTEWLSPLPSKCLPCLQIRESILRLLADFPRIDSSLLKHSGIGKALMFLRKHPDETKENQERCNRIIAKWARPLHDLSCDYRAMTKRERQLRDYALAARYNKQKSKATATATSTKKIKTDIPDITQSCVSSTEATRPGDPGWIPHARVPQPSVRDYIRRPESKLQCEISTQIKPDRLEVLSKKYQKAQKDKTIKYSGAKLSIVGDKI